MTDTTTEPTTDTKASTKASKSKSKPAPTVPSAGDKFTGRHVDPLDVVIIGWDTSPPADLDSPLIHRIHQAERLADIKRDGVADLKATILAAEGVVTAIEGVKVKIDGQVVTAASAGRRRLIAARELNEELPEINKARKAAGQSELPPFTVKVIMHSASDPNLWIRVRSENAGRAADSPLAVAADVARMLEGDPRMGVPPMSHEQIGAVYGKNHQFSRAMAKLNAASPKVQAALRKGKLSQTAAQEIATIKDHEEQDERLEAVLAEGGKTAKAKAAARSARAGSDKITGPTPRKVGELREALRGIEEQIRGALTESGSAFKAARRELLAAAGALAWALGEDELFSGKREREDHPEVAEISEEMWLLVSNAQEPGAALLKADAESARAADKAAAEAEKAAEKAKQKAAKEAEKAAKKAAKEAERKAAKAKKDAEKAAADAKKAAEKAAEAKAE